MGSGLLPAILAGASRFVMLVVVLQLLLLVSASVDLRRSARRDRFQIFRRIIGAHSIPTISVLVPAYREEITIVDSVESLLALNYSNVEIVVVNDGSPDGTLDRLIEHFDLRSLLPIYRREIATADVRAILRSAREPRLVVVDKFNGGKADALNVGLSVATGELVCVIDADTLVAPDALQQLVVPFLRRPDTVAVGGTVRLTNGSTVRGARVVDLVVPKRWLVRFQAVEYIRAFTIGRVCWNPLGGNLIISGAFGLFRRSRLLDIGGYERDTVGEDMELIVRLRRRGYETGQKAWVEFLPGPVAWTEAPESIRVLARQRNRWERGLMDVLWRHRAMLFNPRYGSAGLLTMPYFAVVELIWPIFELAGLVLIMVGVPLGWLPVEVFWYVLAALFGGALQTVLAVWLDGSAFSVYERPSQRLRIIAVAVAEQFVYHPITLVWRLWGVWLYLRGRAEWGEQVRRGLRPSTPPAT